MWFALVRPDDSVRQFVSADTADEAILQALDGERAVPHDGERKPGAVYQDGAIVWPGPTLDQIRADTLAAAKAYRDQRQNGGCTIAGIGQIDTDFQRSVPIISVFSAAGSGALAAKIAFGTTNFTLADKSQVALGPTKAAQLAIGLKTFFDACQQAYASIEAEITVATDPAAVDITAGYPA